jgi:FkbM family methyltransferase
MKALLKKSSLLVAIIRWWRVLSSRVTSGTLHSILSWSNWNLSRRLLLFEALPQRFAYAEHPKESYFVNTSDQFIGRMLYARGDFDLQKFEKAYQLIGDADVLDRSKGLPVLVDVGANIGSICIPAVKRRYVTRSIAIEPDRENVRLLRINSLLNEVEESIDVHRAAVGDRTGRVMMSRNSNNSGDHRVVSGSSRASSGVSMVELDSFADQINLSNTILWIDIQGHEGFAIKGAQRFVNAAVPIVLEFTKQDLVAAECFDLLITEICKSPYKFYYDLNDTMPKKNQLTEDALRKLADVLDAAGTFTDILLLPA